MTETIIDVSEIDKSVKKEGNKVSNLGRSIKTIIRLGKGVLTLRIYYGLTKASIARIAIVTSAFNRSVRILAICLRMANVSNALVDIIAVTSIARIAIVTSAFNRSVRILAICLRMANVTKALVDIIAVTSIARIAICTNALERTQPVNAILNIIETRR